MGILAADLIRTLIISVLYALAFFSLVKFMKWLYRKDEEDV